VIVYENAPFLATRFERSVSSDFERAMTTAAVPRSSTAVPFRHESLVRERGARKTTKQRAGAKTVFSLRLARVNES